MHGEDNSDDVNCVWPLPVTPEFPSSAAASTNPAKLHGPKRGGELAPLPRTDQRFVNRSLVALLEKPSLGNASCLLAAAK